MSLCSLAYGKSKCSHGKFIGQEQCHLCELENEINRINHKLNIVEEFIHKIIDRQRMSSN